MLCVDVCRFTDTKNFELILIIKRLGFDGRLVAKKKKEEKKKKKRENRCNELGSAQF